MNTPRIAWYRTPVEKDRLMELNRRSDLYGFLQAGSLLLLCLATGTGCYAACETGDWRWILPAFFLHGTVTSFAGSVSTIHELSHGTPFKTKFLNEFFIRIFSFISWTNFVFFRTSHAKHHQLTLHKGQDLEIVLPMHFRPVDALYALTFNPFWIVQQLKTHLRHGLGKIEGEWECRIFPEDNAENRRALINWARILVAGHLALAILFIAIGQWILIPIALLPFYCSWLAILCGFPQHAGLKSDVDDFRYLCRTMLLSPVPRYFYWNMNYHTEHHMYPAVPFWQLPKLHRLIAPDMPNPNIGLLSAWREIVYIQSRQKIEPGYTYDQFERE